MEVCGLPLCICQSKAVVGWFVCKPLVCWADHIPHPSSPPRPASSPLLLSHTPVDHHCHPMNSEQFYNHLLLLCKNTGSMNGLERRNINRNLFFSSNQVATHQCVGYLAGVHSPFHDACAKHSGSEVGAVDCWKWTRWLIYYLHLSLPQLGWHRTWKQKILYIEFRIDWSSKMKEDCC